MIGLAHNIQEPSMLDAPQNVTEYPTIISQFGYSPSGPAIWDEDDRIGLANRDLSLFQASSGVLGGHHLRSNGVAKERIQLAQADDHFAFFFVLTGRAIVSADSAEYELNAMTAAMELENRAVHLVQATGDFAELRQAMAEKRPPDFQNR